MSEKIILLIMAAFLVEFVVQAIKKSLHPWELVSTGVGILIAVLVQVNIIDVLLVTEGVRWWIGAVLTGIIIGRGASFVYSLIGKLQDVGKPIEGELLEARWGTIEKD